MNRLTHYLSHKTQNLRKRFDKIGLAGVLKFVLGKATGAVDCQRQLDTLYYLLNHYVDITKLAPATGTLRQMQLCNAVLLSIFDGICKKQGWTYFAGAGTLLGAVRHKGFIPWDDDIDVYMPRKDYDQIMKKCPEIFAEYGSDTLELLDWKLALNIGYKLRETAVMMDIFPVDIVDSGCDDEAEGMRVLARRVKKYRSFYVANSKKLSREKLSNAGEAIINGGGGVKFALLSPEFHFHFTDDPVIISTNIIFPPSTVEFEGITLSAPHDTHRLLVAQFGEDYMSFPRGGVGQHDRVQRIEKSGVDMDEVMTKLRDMEKFFRAEL